MKVICYTNSKCKDIWEMYVKQFKKNCDLDLIFLSDEQVLNEKTFLYNNFEQFYIQWVNFLKGYSEEYLIYNQEDFILYDKVKYNVINDYLNLLKNNIEYSYIRLIRSGISKENVSKISNTLLEVSYNDINFSMQSCIWRTSDFYKVMENSESPFVFCENILDITSKIFNIKGLVHYNNENKRGDCHFDSNVWPYIATALVKKKWNFKEYNNELTNLLKTYNIDENDRGKF